MEHKDITDPNIHEVKGASTATIGQVLTATGAGTATFQALPTFSNVEVGWYDYNDTATTTTPIPLTTAGTYYDLTNNGLGVNTQTIYGISGIADIYNTSTNRFDFSELELGDTLDIRVDVAVTTTSANTAVDIVLELATGTGTPVIIPLTAPTNIKTASTVQILAERSFYMGSLLTKDNPAKLKMRADTTGATVKVNGWYVRVIKRG